MTRYLAWPRRLVYGSWRHGQGSAFATCNKPCLRFNRIRRLAMVCIRPSHSFSKPISLWLQDQLFKRFTSRQVLPFPTSTHVQVEATEPQIKPSRGSHVDGKQVGLSEAAETEEKQGKWSSPGGYEPFPWGSAPEAEVSAFGPQEKSMFQRLRYYLSTLVVREMLAKKVAMHTNAVKRDVFRSLSGSTRFAFIQAVRAIFEGTCKTPEPTWKLTYHDARSPSSEWELGYPPLSAMMEPKLASLYENLVSSFRAKDLEVRYELESIRVLSLAGFRAIVGLREAQEKPERSSVNIGALSLVFGKPVTVPSESERKEPVPISILYRMAVTFRCRELFTVRNSGTGEVLQGEDRMKEVDHVARFEVKVDEEKVRGSEGDDGNGVRHPVGRNYAICRSSSVILP